AAVLGQVRAFPRARAALPVSFARSEGIQASPGGSTQTTGAAVVVGLPPDYQGAFPAEIRHLVGARDGVLLAQQAAANLHATPGDTIAIARGPLRPLAVRVDGIVALPFADSLFRRVGQPPAGPPSAPPDHGV